MTYEKLRWICFVLLIVILLGLGYEIDIVSMQQQIELAKKEQTRLMQEWKIIEAVLKEKQASNLPAHVPNSAKQLLATLVTLAQMYGLVWQSLNITQVLVENGTLRTRGVLYGSFQQINNFMQAAGMNASMVINDFTLTNVAQDQLKLNADMIVYHAQPSFAQVDQATVAVADPFCHGAIPELIENPKAIQQVSLTQLKMVGYVKKSNRIQAWLVMPDSVMTTVMAGEVIGKENAVVTTISPEAMMLMLPDGSLMRVMATPS